MQTLLLIPTRLDMKYIMGSERVFESPWPDVMVTYAGFGPLLAAINVTRLLMEESFDRCLIAGLAGTYDPDAVPVGKAVICSGFHQYGFGYCEDGQIRSYSQTLVSELIDAEDYMPATWLPEVEGVQHVQSLSVMSASGDVEEAQQRHDWFPQMKIEEMEGYAAALACSKLEVPFTSVRGICNVAGDRDHSKWEFEKQGKTIRELLDRILG